MACIILEGKGVETMKRIMIIFLALLLSACTPFPFYTGYYNVNLDSNIFVVNHMIYAGIYQWKVYDLELESLSTLSADTSLNIQKVDASFDKRYSLYPSNDGVVMFQQSHEDKSTSMVISRFSQDSSVPKEVINLTPISLIDEHNFKNASMLNKDKFGTFNIFSKTPSTLDTDVLQMVLIYQDRLYYIHENTMYSTDFFGKNTEDFDVDLNATIKSYTFGPNTIYYLDKSFNLIQYEIDTKISKVILENVFQFYISHYGIDYVSLDDGFFYRKIPQSNKTLLLSKYYDSEMQADDEYVYYYSAKNNYDIYRHKIGGETESFVHKNIGQFRVLDECLAILTHEDELLIIDK